MTDTSIYFAAHIKQCAQTCDLAVRRKYMGASALDQIDGPIHPQGPAAADLRVARDLLRDMADAIDAKLRASVKVREVA